MKRKAAYLQVTRKCNNECVFCSNPQFEKEYSLNECKKVVIEFKKDGINEIFLTGGEPTLAPFLPELIKYIKSINIEPRLITNGIKLSDKDFTEKLFISGLKNVSISIHSHIERIADSLSQRKGHFRKAILGLKNAIDIGMNVILNSTINSLNCKYLLEYVKFFSSNFPKIKHFVFNNLDPGKSDGRMKSRAGENPWIVAKYVDFELELKRMVDFLIKNNKTFRIERVPLCYMQGFEEFSTETRKIVKEEIYICSFIKKEKGNEIRKVTPDQLRTKFECCKYCKLKKICAGVQPEYVAIHGSDEFFPVFTNPEEIILSLIHI